jgi:hypothetical protein
MKQRQKNIQRLNETKSWFFENINKIEKPLKNLTKMRKENTQISKIRNAKGEITTNTTEIQGIIKDYFENIYSDKLENLEEMDHPKPNQEDINHLNRSVTHNGIEVAINSLPPKKVQDLMDSPLNSSRPLKKN